MQKNIGMGITDRLKPGGGDGDECKAVERQALQAWSREFESLHPCYLTANVAERMRREIVALADAGSSPVVRPRKELRIADFGSTSKFLVFPWGRGREGQALDCRSRLREFESRRSRCCLPVVL
jgi:hypothetical protein